MGRQTIGCQGNTLNILKTLWSACNPHLNVIPYSAVVKQLIFHRLAPRVQGYGNGIEIFWILPVQEINLAALEAFSTIELV